jgi:hypothetical protein
LPSAGREFSVSPLWVAQTEKITFSKKLCYLGVDERIRLQEQKRWGIISGQEIPKTIF